MKTINLQRVAKIQAAMHGDQKALEEPDRWLYYYGSVYTFIEGGKASTLTEDEAANRLKEYPAMTVTVCKAPKSTTETPGILKGRKGLITKEVTSHEALSNLIAAETGVRVQVEELSKQEKQPVNASQSNQGPVVNIGRVRHIIGLLNIKDTTSKPMRLFCAAGYTVTAEQRAFGLQVRVLINKLNSR